MKILLNPLALTLCLLLAVLLARAQDSSKYETCVETDECKRYTVFTRACGVAENVDITTPRLLSSKQLMCLCITGEFLKSIVSCLECIGYSSSAWKSTCSSSSRGTSTTTSTTSSSTSSYSDYAASINGSSSSSSLFGSSKTPLLGDNGGWGPHNTAIVVGSCFGGISAIALIGIAICIFRRRQKKAKTVETLDCEDGIDPEGHHDERENNELTPVPAVQPEVRSEPERAERSHGSRRERGHQRRGDDAEQQSLHIHPAYDR